MAITWITAQDLADPSSPYAEEAAKSASFILYKLSAEKYAGPRTATDVYISQGGQCSTCLADDSLVAAGISESAHRHLYVPDTRTKIENLRLRGRPVTSVAAVVDSDGAELPTTSYRLLNAAYVRRTDGRCWDFSRGVTITYSYGVYPPSIGVAAAIKLGNEFLKLYTDATDCQLPERVTAVSRQGISYTVLDPQTFLQDGRTGIYEIDLFLKAVNPTGAKKRPRVFSPDTPRGER